ncbi:hypothetical protein X975_02412, partial [Stegodyphus mimosarum]
STWFVDKIHGKVTEMISKSKTKRYISYLNREGLWNR